MTPAKAVTIAALVPIAWFVFEFYAHAQEAYEQTLINAEGVELLKEIHATQSTTDQVIANLCALGKLDGPDCPATLPPVSAPPRSSARATPETDP